MIARAFVFFVILIVLPDFYIWRQCFRGGKKPVLLKALWVMQAVAMLAFTGFLAMSRDFTLHPQTSLNVYLFLIGVWIVPKCFLAIALWVKNLVRNRGCATRLLATTPWIVFALATIYITIYGSTIGYGKLVVRHVDYYSAELPDAFDGYRIAVFSDAHVGSCKGMHKNVLKNAVDSINALNPDAIFFLGDMQNTRPEEVIEHIPTLKMLNARDGVFSVLGNHDYSYYMGGSEEEKHEAEKQTIACQRKMGWKLLLNENVVLHKGEDSVVVAGLEGNDKVNTDHGYPRCDLALKDVNESSFIIMLVHNPARWKEMVLPNTTAQLTLSGHTHGGQVDIFGLLGALPVEGINGMYEKDGRALFVTAGLGALIPLRFNVNGEVVLLTLKKQKQNKK